MVGGRPTLAVRKNPLSFDGAHSWQGAEHDKSVVLAGFDACPLQDDAAVREHVAASERCRRQNGRTAASLETGNVAHLQRRVHQRQ